MAKKQTCIRLEEEVLREFKKWLIDKGYRSINQFLNECIRNLLEKEERLPKKDKEKNA
jgi:metal-responsive CopG/Arc/MetJ family transcriptional regulator